MVLVRFFPESGTETGIRAVVTRPSSFGEPNILVLTDKTIHPLLGLESDLPIDSEIQSRVRLGPALYLKQRRASSGALVSYALQNEDEFWRATCDAATGLVYINTKSLILQLDLEGNKNIISVLAGTVDEEESVDGLGLEARVDRPFCIVTDGHGRLLIKDCGSSWIRSVQLPGANSPIGAPSPSVTTLPHEHPDNLWALAIDYANPQPLYVATKTAIYRYDTLPYSLDPPLNGAPEDHPDVAPSLLAGREDDHERSDGCVAPLRGPRLRLQPVGPHRQPAQAAAAADGAVLGDEGHEPMGGVAGAVAGNGVGDVFGAGGGRGAGGEDHGDLHDDVGGGGGGPGGVAVGQASSVRFMHINYMLVDSAGRLLVLEREDPDERRPLGKPVLRIIWPCGTVTTFVTNFNVSGSEFAMAILPYSWLAVHAWDGTSMHLLRLGTDLRPSLPPPPLPMTHGSMAGAAGGSGGGGAGGALGSPLPGRPGLAGLAADLAALLQLGEVEEEEGEGGEEEGWEGMGRERGRGKARCGGDGVGGAAAGGSGGAETGGIAGCDVVVVVGGRRFGCHRAILAARCEYFRRLFAGGFADSDGSEISLPDADPDAFAALLRYLYAASLNLPPHLLRPVAQLADRLLLPAASDAAQRRLLVATRPGTVVDDLLWAEQHGFTGLLKGLKDYYLAHAHELLEDAPGSLETLMFRSPKLHLELYAAGIKRARR